MDYDRLTESEFARLLAAVDAVEGALHAFRTSLAFGGDQAARAWDDFNREHMLLVNFTARVSARQAYTTKEIRYEE